MYDDEDDYDEYKEKYGEVKMSDKMTVFKIQPDHRGGETAYEMTFRGPPGMQHATAIAKQLLEIARCMKRDKFSSNYMLRLPVQIDVQVEDTKKPKKTPKK